MAAAETEIFRAAVSRGLGLQFSDDRLDFLETVLLRRVHETGRPVTDYLHGLSRDSLEPAEAEALAEALTVTETFFFRNADHFRALVSEALPQCAAADRRPRLLSAACASGEEAYSLAMTLKENFFGLGGGDILAVDANPAMLRAAAKGLYSPWALRETPDLLRDKYFRPVGKNFQVRGDILSAVRFERRNLADANADLWQPASFDVVFCRNLIMYLDPEVAAALVSRIAKALTPGGHLFLGHAETLRGLSHDFRLCHTHETFYYRRLEGASSPGLPEAAFRAPAPRYPTAKAPAVWDSSASWVETIRRSSQRIEDLAKASPDADKPAAAPWNLAPTLELLGQERFADARESLDRLTQGAGRDGDVLLLDAVLLVNLGRLAEARDACERLLKSDAFNAGAHYVMALCREHAGDNAAAAEEDRAASYLDPSFALPLLHLGLLARRDDPWRSRAYLERALQLLAKEDSSRVLLFGGGFGRQGLIQICRSALDSSGVAP